MENYEKKYKEALEWARKVMQGEIGFVLDEVLEKFPELTESGDERVRKALITFFQRFPPYERIDDAGTIVKEAIAWLEKQGEQKPYGQRQECVGCQSNYAGKCKGYCAMKRDEQKPADLPNGEYYGIDGLYAAIDILQKTLGKVEGYQTDDGILEHECAISAVKKLYEQKPAWSEEDERMLNDIIKDLVLPWDEYIPDRIEYGIKWLKNRFKSLRPQNTWKPSDEQIEALDFAADCIVPAEFCFKRKELKGLLEQLKKLRGE